MFDFIYYNFNIIFAVVVFLIGAVYLGAEIQTHRENQDARQRRSESARRGWITRRMNQEQ